MTRGTFITFEGGEGAGKTTQIKLLSEALNKANIEHITTREPGGTEGAEAIRELIVTGDTDRWDAKTETLLIMAARHHHVHHVILPALNAGKWVVCDRFLDSTLVYQGITKGIDKNWIHELYKLSCGKLTPDITFILDIDPEIGVTRSKERANDETRFESMDLAFHKNVREGFLKLAKQDTRYCICDASQAIDALHCEINNMLPLHAEDKAQC